MMIWRIIWLSLWDGILNGCLSFLCQVFHSLLKAHTMEARAIVRQAMAILTPAVPARMEDGHQMLTHWTRKIIVEEGHTVPQLVHILHLIVQHFRVSRRKKEKQSAHTKRGWGGTVQKWILCRLFVETMDSFKGLSNSLFGILRNKMETHLISMALRC